MPIRIKLRAERIAGFMEQTQGAESAKALVADGAFFIRQNKK